jgi:hypothetical protein
MSKSDLKKVKWKEVEAPTSWRPRKGDELIGWYAGKTVKNGRYGEYTVITVLVPYQGAVMVSGSKIIQLADTAMIRPGEPIKIVYCGKIDIGEDRKMKTFKMYMGEGESLATENIPERFRS